MGLAKYAALLLALSPVLAVGVAGAAEWTPMPDFGTEAAPADWFLVQSANKVTRNDGTIEVAVSVDEAKLQQQAGQAVVMQNLSRDSVSFSDWSGYRALSFDINNTAKQPIRAAVALHVGEGPEWIASKQLTLQPGLNKGVTFDFEDATLWQGAASEGKFAMKIPAASSSCSTLTTRTTASTRSATPGFRLPHRRPYPLLLPHRLPGASKAKRSRLPSVTMIWASPFARRRPDASGT